MIEIIGGSEKEINEFHKRGWGKETLIITEEHIEALRQGKALGIDDGEYTHVLVMGRGE